MKILSTKLWPVLLVCLIFTACDDDDDPLVIDDGEDFSELESEWVRLSLLRPDGIDVMQTNTGEIVGSAAFDLPEGGGYYTSNSGRYLIVTERANNMVRFFDSGVINHTDHGHQEAVGWLDMTVSAPLPTHVTSSGGHTVVFNDGDGSFTHVNEAQIELPGYEPETYTYSTVAHHGAGFRLNNGQFAITFKNNTEPGGIPQMVKFIDANGNVIDDNGGVEVAGIHGDAVNGDFGVFGATDGVILVDNQGNIDLIPNIDSLRNESGYWIGTLKGHDETSNFFGRATNVGAFLVDPMNMSLTQIYEGDDIAADMLSFDGDYYVLHTAHGDHNHLHVYDAESGSLVAERELDMVTPGGSGNSGHGPAEGAPVIVSSDDYLYVLTPDRLEIQVFDIETLEDVHTITLDREVTSIAYNGFTED